jgi:DNA polymerase III epsilon subunit-like protein
LAILFDTQVQPTHRALDDARTTVDVLYGLFERSGDHDVTTLHSLFELMRKKSVRGKAHEYGVHWQIREEFASWEQTQQD